MLPQLNNFTHCFSLLNFQAVVDCGALEALVICLEEFDPGVKESAAWALGYVARHNAGWRNKYIVELHFELIPYNFHLCI